MQSLQHLSNMSRKRQGISLIFCIKINMKVFYKLILSLLVTIDKHAQSTQNNNFVKSLHYLKKERKDELDLLHADKHQTFLQLHTINNWFYQFAINFVLQFTSSYYQFWWALSVMSKVPNITSLKIIAISQEKSEG